MARHSLLPLLLRSGRSLAVRRPCLSAYAGAFRNSPKHLTRQLQHSQAAMREYSTSPPAAGEPAENKYYQFEDIKSFVSSPSPSRILIDVREPAEVNSTGRIPGAQLLPITSQPEGLFLPAHEFETKFGFPKPKSTDEVVFYCRSGVRSRAAAGIARSAGWTKIGEYAGSWIDWEKKGGEKEIGRD